jgi:hypothetical protein
VRPHGKTKLGLFPLPTAEAERLRHCLAFASEFSALDPCVGDGVAFAHLLNGTQARGCGVEIDANRAEQAARLGSDTLHANTVDVRCPAESLSLLYLNPPYDFETDQSNNQRLELVFLEHTYRRLRPTDVLAFVHSTTAIKSLRADLERALHRTVCAEADGAGQRSVQADCCVGSAAQAIPASARLRAAGLRALAGNVDQ